MNTKKFASAAVAALVGLGLFGAIAPAAAGPDHTSTITLSGGSIEGHSFSAYRIATYTDVQPPTGEVTSFKLETQAAFLNAIKDFVGSKDPLYLDVQDSIDPLDWVARYWDDNGDNAWADETSAAPTVRALANYLAQQLASGAIVESEDVPLQPDDTEQSVPDGESGTFMVELGVPEGLYLVIEASSTDGATLGASTNSLPIILGTKFMTDNDISRDGPTGGTIDIKGDYVPFDKDIVNAIDKIEADRAMNRPESAAFTGTEAQAAPTEIEDAYNAFTGETIEFRITSRIPDYPDSYRDPVFAIYDNWSEGLETPTDFSVKANGTSLVEVPNCTGAAADTWSLGAGSGDRSIVITICDPAAQAAKEIVVDYTATVLRGGTEETWDWNQAYAEFTNEWWVKDEVGNDGSSTTDVTVTDEVDLYTFPLQLFKADIASYSSDDFASSKFLGATFEVFDAQDQLVGEIITVEDDSTGSFVVAPGTSTPKGLPGDTWYKVQEKYQPVGYTPQNLDVAWFWVYIYAEAQEGDIDGGHTQVRYLFSNDENPPAGTEEATATNTVYVRPVVGNGDQTDDLSVLVLNAKSASEMPQTGGQILLWVTVAGVLGLGAVSFAVIGIRKSRAQSASVA